MEIKNRDIEPILFELASYNAKTGAVIKGLLHEKISLGTQRILQKIQKELGRASEELKKDLAAIQVEMTKRYEAEVKDKSEDDAKILKKAIDEEASKERDILLDESVTFSVQLQPVAFSKLEGVVLVEGRLYDWDMIEKICDLTA